MNSRLEALATNSVSRAATFLLSKLQSIAAILAPPVLRIALALPFFRSGLTRWDSFLSLSPGTTFLFEEQFKLHILGRLYSFPFPDISAFTVGVLEITLPILLFAGVATRFAATGLLLMTGVIQLVFPDGWANFHLYWAAISLALIALGPGALSFDHLLMRIFMRKKVSEHEDGARYGECAETVTPKAVR